MLFPVLLSFIVVPVLGARILGIMPSASYSHQTVFHPIWKELSLRGHQVTLLTTLPMKDPSLTNLTEIDLSFSYQIWDSQHLVNMSQMSIMEVIELFLNVSDNLIEAQLQHPEVQTLIKNESEHFDLVMAENMFTVTYAFAERFKCPLITLDSSDATNYDYESMGNPVHPLLYPEIFVSYNTDFKDLTITKKIINLLVLLAMKYYSGPQVFHRSQLLIHKYFGDDYPLLEDMYKNVSMMFVNTNPIFHHIRPLVPTIIQIGGGTHLRSSKPLPVELQRKLDAASQGFIYFSLGSNVKGKHLPDKVLQTLLQSFSELPYLILWKFELEDLPGRSENVIISKWFPQQDILRHPNIKLFITQGGLQSMEEAIYNHIPVIGMPVVGDQEVNAGKIVAEGFGLAVDYKNLEKENFKSTILEVINNSKYKKRVKEISNLLQDQPMTGLERAVWWTEYVLRHKGAKHLRSPAIDLPSYQYYLLDVIGFCLAVLTIIIFVTIKTIKLIFKLIRSLRSKEKVKVQ